MLTIVSVPGKRVDVITLESDAEDPQAAMAELQSPEAIDKALQHAASLGVVNPSYGIISAPYPVTADGESLTDLRQRAFRYRIDIPIVERF